MAIGDHNKYLPIRLEIIRIRRYNKRYIAPADAGEAWKKGRNREKHKRNPASLQLHRLFCRLCQIQRELGSLYGKIPFM